MSSPQKITEAPVPLPGESKGQMKKRINKERQLKRKADAKAAKAAQQGSKAPVQQNEPCSCADAGAGDNFGDAPLHQSQTAGTCTYVPMTDLPNHIGKTVDVSGRLNTVRLTSGKLAFIIMRDGFNTVQVVVAGVPAMVKFASGIPVESWIHVQCEVKKVDTPVSAATGDLQGIELQAKQLWVETRAAPLPFSLADVEVSKEVLAAEEAEFNQIQAQCNTLTTALAGMSAGDMKTTAEKDLKELERKRDAAKVHGNVNQKTRLDNRVVDLRAPSNKAIFIVQDAICRLFSEFLSKNGFLQIRSPKLISAASEGGAEVFKLQYFGGNAYLAQSPQFYKQMAICADLDRVFEIGPVFRAENSFTHRHMCEFNGLDMEMRIGENYTEVLDMLDATLIHIFTELPKQFPKELAIIRSQFPVEPLVFDPKRNLRINFSEAIALLRAAPALESAQKHFVTVMLSEEKAEVLREECRGLGDYDDIGTSMEKLLGRLIKDKYNTDFFILDKFPAALRPFYTMPDPKDARLSNSYDLFIRGEEICSGAQRIHDVDFLTKRFYEKNGPDAKIDEVQSYIDAFKYGAPPHGGGGIGMERLVMLYLGLPNIRRTSLFPRDPKRLTP
eukprot:TRINITY_DN11070_c0_g1_i1.p1 TRINITY_DN11070_c0_g1~~TRINITY_DN11070_c0_g1_i1.p1  ORF type:complete len:614 (+),score=190.50 TRINITY_DN11070_c0_g1_i1:174-2015(+)